MTTPLKLTAAAAALAALTVATWYGFLGWDHEYQLDPVTGYYQGPYETWQVVGCGLTLIALALVAGVAARPWLPVAVMPLAFTVAWSVDAAGQDETGMFGVGAIMLLIGLAAAGGVVAAVAGAVRNRGKGGGTPYREPISRYSRSVAPM